MIWVLAILIFGGVILYGSKWVSMSRARVESQADVKAVVVVNILGDVVDHDGRIDGLLGQSLVHKADKRLAYDIRSALCRPWQKELAFDTSLGRVELARCDEGRWIGVVK